jgi:hypothetical protein
VPVSGVAEAATSPVLRPADQLQAEYFLRALDACKSELCELLEVRMDELAGCQRAGDLASIRRHQRIQRSIKELESEIRRVDRMLVALRVRLGLPTLRRMYI